MTGQHLGREMLVRSRLCASIQRPVCGSRSIRRSVRSGSIKLKQTYEHLMENGDIGAMNRVSSSRSRPQDLDIKLLQAKRQQAEMRRYVLHVNTLLSNENCSIYIHFSLPAHFRVDLMVQ